MCGVAAFISKEKLKEADLPSLDLIQHRGPDAQGFWQDEQVWLGHTRLSILDLSEAGNQPMTSKCGNYILVYNGEIYNHLELRREHLPDQHFVGHSDTETILALFCKLKENMLSKMVGMWAILIYDIKAKSLFISRDRFGQKPLYIRKLESGWKFASEMKVLGFGSEPLTFNPTAIADYLSSGNYGHLRQETFYREIRQFPAGEYAFLRLNEEDLKTNKYWNLPYGSYRRDFDSKTKLLLKDLMVEAVMSQTLSDVPIGITLSGGIDSSIIAGILAEHYPYKVHVFTAQTRGHALDETKYVDEVLKRFHPDRIVVHRIDLNTIPLTDTLVQFLEIQEEPFGDPSISAHGLLMKAAKAAGIKVILGGQGADEIFAGYDHALSALLSAQLKTFHLFDFFNNSKKLPWPKASWARFSLAFFLPALENKFRMNKKLERETFIDPAWIKGRKSTRLARSTLFNAVLEESLFEIHLPHLLHYDDRNAMHFGVEGRTPFLDHRILELLCEIHPQEFFKDGKRKYLLREACNEYLPDLIRQRRDKIGFFTPLKSMLLLELENLSRVFTSSLQGEMKKILLEDLEGIRQDKTDIISILRVYRVYSVIKLCEMAPVTFSHQTN